MSPTPSKTPPASGSPAPTVSRPPAPSRAEPPPSEPAAPSGLQRPRPPRAVIALDDRIGEGGPERLLTAELTWQVRDAGVQCVAAPCPTFRAIRIQEKEPQREEVVHEVDFSRAKLSERELARVQAQLTNGLRVEGRLRWVPDRGPAGGARILEVRRVLPGR